MTMGITKRLMTLISSGFVLAAAPGAEGWKPRRAEPSFEPGLQPDSSPPPPGPTEQTDTYLQPPEETSGSKYVAVFVSGAVFASAVAAGLWLLTGLSSSTLPATLKATVARLQPSPPPLAQRATCDVEPVTVAASNADGRFPLQTSGAGLMAADIASLLVIGNEAVAAGRPRDAEAAFLMSCRVADELKGPGSVELADAKYHLGSLYARLALGGTLAAGTDRAELIRRAEPMYLDSLQTSIALQGEAGEKSQLAAQGLARLRQTLAQELNSQTVPVPVATAAPVQAASVPVLATTPVPVPAKVPQREAASVATQPPPARVQPMAVASPAARTVPPVPAPAPEPEVKPVQNKPAGANCPEAVATLGLCNPGR
jgi:hypothetical protein